MTNPPDPWSQHAMPQPPMPQPPMPQPPMPQPPMTQPPASEQAQSRPTPPSASSATSPGAGYTAPSYPAPGGVTYPTYSGSGDYPNPAGYPAASGYPAYPGGGAQPGYPAAGGYPGYPGAGAGGGTGPVPPVPGTVRLAFGLWMLVLVVGIVSSVLLFSGSYYDEMLRATQLSLPSDQAEIVGRFGTSLFVLIAGIGIAISLFIYLFFGFKMRAGRNWARIVLTVFGGLSVLGTLVGSGSAALVLSDVSVQMPTSAVAAGWVGALAAAAAIVAMFLRESNGYFSAVKIARAAR